MKEHQTLDADLGEGLDEAGLDRRSGQAELGDAAPPDSGAGGLSHIPAAGGATAVRVEA